MPTFDTVSELREWLDSEEPDVEMAEAALEDEREGPDRVTGKRALQKYIDDTSNEPDTPDDSNDVSGNVKFRVKSEIEGYARGEVVHLDPDNSTVQSWRRDDRIRRWLS